MSGKFRQKWLGARDALLLIAWLSALPALAGTEEERWWPVQAFPKAIVRASYEEKFPAPRVAQEMLLQSVAGLAAQAVNEGRGDELVWVDTGNTDMEAWRARLLAKRPDLQDRAALGPLELVDRYARQGIIKGYILYRADTSRFADTASRPGVDYSVNVATSLAGLLDGILVDERLETAAKAHGLTMLLDARGKTPAWCFQTYRNRFNRRIICVQDPQKPHLRDLVIAQRAFTVFGSDPTVAAAMKWLEPLSPVIGWNCGDEFANTDLATRNGQIQTGTDWCMNLPVLMAGTEKMDVPKAKGLDPRTIDWNDRRSGICFIDTDGDNVEWCEGNFFHGDGSYWDNPARGKITFGWSCCFAHLAQMCPEAIEYELATQSTNDSFVEWGGGYYYPDHFASDRPDRWELLARHAQRTWGFMQKTGTRVIGFNFTRIDSADGHKACEVFASQTDGLLAILAFQYYPYEGGAGKVFWVKDRNGVGVPVISARYSIWEHSNERERSGTPAKIAREIRETVARTPAGELPRYDWVTDHAWSWFKKSPGSDENAENLPQDGAESHGGERGYTPAVWCAERLPATIRVIGPEEMAWRIRMQHDPAQTKRFMSRFQ